MDPTRTLTGKVELSPMKKVSRNGNDYCLFTFSDGNKRYRLRAFGDVCKSALSSIKTQDKIVVDISKIEAEEDDPDLFSAQVNGFRFEGEKQKKIVSRKKQDSIMTDEYIAMMKKKGSVWAQVGKDDYQFERAEHCIKLKGDRYVSKIYFILFVLGAKKVIEICKQEGVGITENLAHFDRVREDLLGCAITDFQNKTWVGDEDNRD